MYFLKLLTILPLASITNCYVFKIHTSTQDPTDKLLSGESFDNQCPVSLFYAVIYHPIDSKPNPAYGPTNAIPPFKGNPCLVLEPAYALVQNNMTFYGTCNYSTMLQLTMRRIAPTTYNVHWESTLKVASQRTCRLITPEEFFMSRRGSQFETVNPEPVRGRLEGLGEIRLTIRNRSSRYDPDVLENFPAGNGNWKQFGVGAGCECRQEATPRHRQVWREMCGEGRSGSAK
ncbi:hypothetical protein pipiens_018483, partial [Culex pipiens pipiens]